jgi:hypothetical protein
LRDRINQENITFLQIGANDGYTNDIASLILKPSDKGVFVEPIKESFEKLISNKKNFSNSKFANLAILPDELQDYNEMNLLSDCPSNLGASFSLFNRGRIVKTEKVDVSTPLEFLYSYRINDLDFLFCNASTLDHLIVLDTVKRIQPKVLFFNTCYWCNNDYELELTDTVKITIPSRKKMKEFLNNLNYEVIDLWENSENKREDILAFKKELNGDFVEIIEPKVIEKLEPKQVSINHNLEKVISFTLFGNNLKYYVGAEKNIEINKKLLPDWTNVIYYHKDSILPGYVEKLTNLGAKLIDVSSIIISGKESIQFQYFWRFFSFFEEGISIVRDLDSRFSEREVKYINEWLKSSKNYFIIRDHPWHSQVPSGLFGIKNKDEEFKTHFEDFIKNSEIRWGSDQDILFQFMERKNKNEVFYCGFDDNENYIPRDNKNFFIGMQIDENEQPLNPSATVALEFLESINL